MPKYQAFTPDVEVIGSLLQSYKMAVNHEAFSAYFAKHGLGNIEPDQWYPVQLLLNVFSDISEDNNFMMNLISIGMSIAEHTPLPPDFDNLSIEDALRKFTEVTRVVNRGTDVGNINFDIVGSRHAKLIYRLPMPDEYLYGVTYGYMRRFLPKGTPFEVRFDPDVERRDNGGAVTTIHVSWKSEYPSMKVPKAE